MTDAHQDVVVFGIPFSTYVRTVRMALEEKEVPHALDPVRPGKAGAYGLHPFRKVPAFRHGPVHLFETLAIARYIDQAFPGVRLQPADIRERALMDQWISVVCDYLYQDAIRDFVLQYAFPKGPDGAPDEARIAAARPRIGRDLDILEGALEGKPYLAGARLTLADLFLAPIVAYLPDFPGGAELLAARPQLSRWIAAMRGRPSFIATEPPPSRAA